MPTTDKPTVTVNFRKLLLNRCQKEFEKDKDDDEVFEKKQKEMDEAATVRAGWAFLSITPQAWGMGQEGKAPWTLPTKSCASSGAPSGPPLMPICC